MPDNRIIQVDESKSETELDRLVSSKVEEILNAMLDTETDQAAGATRYERSGGRKAYPRRPLRTQPDGEGRQHDRQSAEAEGY